MEPHDDKVFAKSLFKDLGARIIEFPDDGYDCGAYMRFAEEDNSEYLCFLNTHSRPLCHNWLTYLLNGILKDDIGICGSTAALFGWKFRMPLLERNFLEFCKLPPRILLRIRNHIRHGRTATEDSHIRTTGFIIHGEHWRKYTEITPFPKNKYDTYRIESGTGSLSGFIKSLGLNLAIVNADGNVFYSTNWSESMTYCFPGQSKLVIADNMSNKYLQMSRLNKRRTEFDTWGKTITIWISKRKTI